MRRCILGFIVGFALLPVLAFFYVFFGFAPVATAKPPLPLERYMAHLALNARISKSPADRGEPNGGRKAIPRLLRGLPWHTRRA